MTLKSSGVYSSPVSGLIGLEHLCVLVVGHRLRGVDVTLEQTDHVELLGDVLDRGRIDAVLGHRREHFPFVAEAPVADLVAGKVLGGGDVLVLEAHLQRARSLEHLGDVDDVGTGLAAGQSLRDPCDCKVGVAVGQHRLRNDVDCTFEDRHLETLIGVEALIDCRKVSGELSLCDPLQLQLDRRRGATLLGRGCRRCGRCLGGGRCLGRRRAAVVATARGGDE